MVKANPGNTSGNEGRPADSPRRKSWFTKEVIQRHVMGNTRADVNRERAKDGLPPL